MTSSYPSYAKEQKTNQDCSLHRLTHDARHRDHCRRSNAVGQFAQSLGQHAFVDGGQVTPVLGLHDVELSLQTG